MSKVSDLLEHPDEHEYGVEKVDFEGGYSNTAELYVEAYCIYPDCDETISYHVDLNVKDKTTKFMEY